MAEAPKQVFKRRIVFIEKDFQRNFIIKFSLVALGAMITASLVLYFLSKDTITATYRFHSLALQSTADAIMPSLIITNVAVLVGFIIATVYVTLYISHKIGGPLYRFSQDLQQIGQGNLSIRIRLRQYDQLRDFAQTINTMVQNLESSALQVEQSLANLQKIIEEPEWDKEVVKKQVQNLHETLVNSFETSH